MGRDRLIVERIEVQDFMGYHEPQAITLAGSGATAVVGSNGAGKSTLVSKALAWGLYGSTAPERMGSGTQAIRGKEVLRRREEPEHMSTPEPKSAHVKVVLRRGDQRFIVYRIRPTRGQDKISVDRLDPTAEHLGNKQGVIDNLVGVPYDVFTKTCLRGQGDPWNFAEATDKRKREILDIISGAQQLSIPHSRVVELRKKAEQAVAVLAARIEDAERRLESLNLEEATAKAQAWERDRAARLQAAQQELEVLGQAWRAAVEEDKRAEASRTQRATLEAQRPTLDDGPYLWAIEERQQACAELRAQLQTLQANIAKAQQLIDAGLCPTCGQSTSNHADAHRVAGKDTTARQGELDQAVQRLAEAREVHLQARQWLDSALASWRAQMAELPQAGVLRAPAAEKAATQARRRAEEIRGALNPWAEVLAAGEAQRRQLGLDLEMLREGLQRARQRGAHAAHWEQVLAPKGVRAHLAEGALAAIEAEANRWLAVLSDGRLSVSFPATRETKAGRKREEIRTVIRVGESERSLLTYSGGEKRRINLAVDLGVAAAFSRGGALALSLLVLDEECFSGLDEQGQAGVVVALQHAGVADVVVIDHDPRLTGVLGRTVRVTRGPDGYSRVEEA